MPTYYSFTNRLLFFKRNLLFIGVFLLLWPYMVYAQLAPNFYFENLTQEDGLSQGTGYSITEYNGFMWFGTQDGLNRFDGYDFKIYKSNGQIGSINNSFVQSLLTDSANRLWVGTGGGLNLFNFKEDLFYRFSQISGKYHLIEKASIRALQEDAHKNIWILTDENGLYCYNPNTKNIEGYFIDDHTIYDIFLDKNGRLWVSNFSDIFLYDQKNNTFRSLPIHTFVPKSVLFRKILFDSKQNLWIGTNEQGCYVIRVENLDSPTPQLELINHFQKGTDKNTLRSNQIVELLEDKYGKIWVATFTGGISIFDYNTSEFVHLNELRLRNSQRGLADNSVFSLYEDFRGIIWIGYSNKGIGKFDRQKSHFKHIAYNPDYPETSLKDNMIFSMCQQNNKLYIGTETGGISVFNLKTLKIEPFPVKLQENKVNEIRRIEADTAGKIWLMNWRSLISFDTHTNKVEEFKIPQKSDIYIYSSLLPKNTDEIWICGHGLYRLNLKTKQWKAWSDIPALKAIEKYTVRSLFQDSQKNIWLGTLGHGLLRYDWQEKTIQVFDNQNDFKCDNVRSFYEDQQTLWVGTDCGLIAIDMRARKVRKQYSENTPLPFRLPNNVIYAILKDNMNYLWLSSNKGLVKFSPTRGVIKNYDINDGLQSNEFNTGVAYRHPDGTLYFGGVNGVSFFNPKLLVRNTFVPSLVMTKIKVMDSLFSPQARELFLSYKQNFIEFEFAALNFSNSQKNHYKYQLEGIDYEWIDAGTKRFANYTSLPAGNYVFRVRGSNNDLVWNQEDIVIKIHIKPPFWGYWWFWPLIGVLVFLVGASGYYLYINYELQNQIKLFQMRNQIASDLHDELGSTLSSIALSTSFLRKQTQNDNRVQEVLAYIEKDAETSINTIRDTVWALNPENDSIDELAEKFRSYAAQLCQTKQIVFQFDNHILPSTRINLSIQQRKNLYLCLKEILNNAVKHSLATKISGLFEIKNQCLSISIQDNGIGFKVNEVYQGNGLKNIRTRAKESNFQLHLESSGIGSHYLLLIPT